MASARKSRRNKTSRAKIALICGAVVAAVAGGIIIFSGDNDSEPTEAEKTLGLDAIRTEVENAGESTAGGRTATGRTPSLANLNQTVSAIKNRIGQAQGQEGEQEYVRSYNQLREILQLPLPPSVRAKVLPTFHQITDHLFLSTIHNDFSEVYIVQPGDSIAKIAKKFGTTQRLLCQWNRIDWAKRSRIRVGDSFKVVKGAPRIEIDKSDFCLSLYFGELLTRQYIVAHGRGNNTPEGAAKVRNKDVDPDKAPHAGPAQLEMDERWIGFTAINGRTGIGVHGTKYEDQIPGETSRGCIRMFNRDVVELYDFLPHGASIKIHA